MGSNHRPAASAALAQLGTTELKVLIVLAADLDPSRLPDFHGIDVQTIIADLRKRRFVYATTMQVDAQTAGLLGQFPAGLAAPSSEPLTNRQLEMALARVGIEERRVLERLTWGPPQGRVRDALRQVTWQQASSPIDRLLATGLLHPIGENMVILPREVALALRGGRVFDPDHDRPALPHFDPESSITPPTTDTPAMTPPPTSGGWRPVLEQAGHDDLWVQLAYAEEDGTLIHAVVRVLSVAHGSAYLVRRAGARLNLPTKRIVSAQLLGPVVINDPILDPHD